MLRNIDSALLARMQRFTDAFQAWTGHTKYRLEKFGWIISTLCMATWFWIAELNGHAAAPGVLMACPILIGGFMGALCAEKCEQAFLARNEIIAPFHSSARKIVLVVGCVMLALDIAFSNNLLFSVGYLILSATYYVNSCYPRPPGRNKAKELAAKLLRFAKGILPQPVADGAR